MNVMVSIDASMHEEVNEYLIYLINLTRQIILFIIMMKLTTCNWLLEYNV